MKFITSIALALLVSLIPVSTVSATTVCSDGMIANTYGIMGETIIPDQTIGYCGITGIIALTKDGAAKGTIKQSCAGMTMLSKGEGTFKVKPNCMGTADIAFDDGTSGTFHFVVTEGGKTLLFIGDQMGMPGMPGITFRGMGKQL
jgi:hypothetical protein